MARRGSVDAKLKKLAALQDTGDVAQLHDALRDALGDGESLLVSEAAALAGRRELRELIPDLAAAMERFYVDPLKTDPNCRAKTALATALLELEYGDADFFLRGMRYVQMEPVWGGEADAAAALRGVCAFGLAQTHCRDPLTPLLELLVDDVRTVRGEAARAIACTGQLAGALLLRLKVLCGDAEPEVLGACFEGLLSLSPSAGVEFTAPYLNSLHPAIRIEAAAALGTSREPEAFAALKARWQEPGDMDFRQALLLAMGASRQQSAIEFLIGLLDEAPLPTALDALEALAPGRFYREIRQRVAAAVEKRESPELQRKFEKEFGDEAG